MDIKLTELVALSEKATQGEWHVSDFAIHGEPKFEENAVFISALVNWFRANKYRIAVLEEGVLMGEGR